jgi:methionyl-tRNA formyltransferase/LmbE family N-acetylglucosaminyl deacetylase
MKKIILISHNIYGFKCLETLHNIIRDSEYEISCVVSRKKTSFLSDQCFEFEDFCNDNNIKYYEVSNIKSNESIEFFQENISDLILVLGWTQLLPNKIIESSKLSLGTHPSILPNNIGNGVIPWHILNNENYGGFTLFELKEQVDSGEIYYQSKFSINENDTSEIYYEKFINEGVKFIETHLLEMLKNNTKIKINDGINESICCKRIPTDSQIDFNESGKNINNLILAMNGPYPTAFGYLKRGSKYFKIEILETEFINIDTFNLKYNAINGTVIQKDKDLYIKLNDGYLKLIKYENKDNIILCHNDRFDNKMTNEIFNILKEKNKSFKSNIEKTSTSNNILVIVAHPDDEAYGCGGYIKKLSENNNVYVLIMTEGCSIQYNSTELVNVKKEESKKVKEILGIKDYFFEDLKDMKLDTYAEVEITQIICRYIDKIKPYIVLTHNDIDLNRDHTTINKSVQVACRPLSGVKKLYTFEVLSTTELSANIFKPNKFINIEKQINDKIKAIEAYESELREYPHGRCKDSVISLAKFRGVCSNFNYAEALTLVKEYED